MLFLLRAETQLVDVLDHVAQVVAALDAVLDLAEDLADLVLDRVRPAGLLLEAEEVREQLSVNKVAQVVARQGLVEVQPAAGVLGRGPALPAVGWVKDVAVRPALELGLDRAVLLQGVEVFQEQQPGGLLGVVQLAGAARVLVQDVVDVLEHLLESGRCRGGLELLPKIEARAAVALPWSSHPTIMHCNQAISKLTNTPDLVLGQGVALCAWHSPVKGVNFAQRVQYTTAVRQFEGSGAPK